VDLTPVIDVVFLLIIFFMLVCQFMAAEQFAVEVPEDIRTAGAANAEQAVTVTVMMDGQEAVCAVGAQRLADVGGKDLAILITSAVNEGLAGSDDKTVRLRCDRQVPFGEVKHILSGISNSCAEELDWAVVNE